MVLAALAVRLAGIHQSLYGDELYTYGDVVGRGLGDVFREVQHVEDNPPGFFVLAWLASKLGEPTLTIRLPSLLFGVATVPTLYWVGEKVAGTRAALLGAALFALSPFAVFYADEARPYAMMTCFVVLAAGLLLAALRTNGPLPWIGFTATVALALYSHYTAVFALAAMGVWAFWTAPASRRQLVLAYAASAVAFLPWLATSPGTGSFKGFAVLYPFNAHDSAEGLVRALVGAPFRDLSDVPGTLAWILLAAATLIAASRALRGGVRLRRLSRELGLVIALALATPAGVALYSGAVSSIFAPRNLIAMLPFACLLAGTGLARLDRPRMLAAATCAVAGLAIGTAATLGDASRRPPWREAAAAIDGSWRPGDVIGQYQPFPVSTPDIGRRPLLDSLRAYLDHPERAVQVDAGNPQALDQLARGRRLRLVVGQITGLDGVPPPPRLDSRFRLLPGRRSWDAFAPVALYEYAIAGR